MRSSQQGADGIDTPFLICTDYVSQLVGLLGASSTVSGVYYDLTSSCVNPGGTCTAYGTGVAGAAYFTVTNDPLARWDFTNLWREVPGGLPELR